VEKKEGQGKKKINKTAGITLADLMIPIVSGLIFLLILFFVLIPSINSSSEMLTEIERVREDQEVLKRNLEIVESLDFPTLQTDLSNARRVLPKRLEVAQFAYYVDSLAKEKGLDFRELKAGDVTISKEDIASLDVKGIRVPMGYAGDYEPILDFFDELQTVSPYVISFGHKVDLRKRGTEDENNVEWGLEIDITGYHVEEGQDLDRGINFSLPIKPYDFDPDMVEIFSERVNRLVD
jgi:Tfp pilus assembly protein PilO